MATILLDQVSKVYPPQTLALETTHLEIQDGEFMVLLGPSGCGKSTTLRLIAGLEEPSTGQISIDDVSVTKTEAKDRNLAMVFQNYALYPHMSVYENMAFGLKMRKLPKAEIKHKVHKIAESLGLSTVLERRPKALSGGQRQRVALGRAIVRDPVAFLFDEPLSNLDAQLRVDMRKELAELYQNTKKTFIYVTHDQTEAMTLGTRICVMDHGKVQQVGTPLEIYNRPKNLFVANFIGTPPMNILEGVIDKKNFIVPEFDLKIDISKLKSKPKFIGIRPEKILSKPQIELENSSNLKAKVHLIEHLGHEQLIYLKSENSELIAKFSPDASLSLGQELDLNVSFQDMHFFDQNENRLTY